MWRPLMSKWLKLDPTVKALNIRGGNAGVDKIWKAVRTQCGINELRRRRSSLLQVQGCLATAPKMSLKLNY